MNIFFKDKLIHFAIMYVHSNEKSPEKHQIDIINQYMMWQMNIHLLRLNNKNMLNYKTEIKSFINKIKHNRICDTLSLSSTKNGNIYRKPMRYMN